MEYASKGDLLTNLIKKAKNNERIIEEREIWRICRTVVQGLKMLHEKNIVHKDIKPQNILMMEDLSVKVRNLTAIIMFTYLSLFLILDRRHGHFCFSCQLRVQKHVSE